MELRLNAYCPKGHIVTVRLTPGVASDYLMSAPSNCQRCEDETRKESARSERLALRKLKRDLKRL